MKLFYTILEVSINLYAHPVGSRRRQHLWALLNSHTLWRQTRLWKDCVFEVVQFKIDEAKKRILSKPEPPAPEEPETPQPAAKSFFKKGFSQLKTLLTKP